MSDFQVKGAEDFLRMSKALKAAGRTDMRKQLNKALKDATKPLIAQTKAATSRLPQSGGLAASVRRAPQRVQILTGRNPGVRIIAGKRGDGARAADLGTIRHPVFGNREVWVNQAVQPRWFTETLEQGAPTVRPHLVDAMEVIAAQIVREAR